MEKLSLTIAATKQKTYPVFIGEDILENISSYIDLSKYTKKIIVTDEQIPQEIIKKVSIGLGTSCEKVIIPSGDIHKNLDNVSKIWNRLVSLGADRSSLVIAVGGGVVSDIAGFAASAYMRGIAYITIPTTLLAQVDSSIGGKTVINFAEVKNLIGSFHQPNGVIIDVDCLLSLPEREFLSGFAEIIKHGLITDRAYFEKVTRKKPREYSKKEMIEIIKQSLKIKGEIVKADVTETGLRKKLNFGHTLGHAIEAVALSSSMPLLHGEAISIGMVGEAAIAKNIGLLSPEIYSDVKVSLEKTGLPTSVSVSFKEVMEKMRSDKKNMNGEIRWTLLKGIGEAVIDITVDNDIIEKNMKEVIL